MSALPDHASFRAAAAAPVFERPPRIAAADQPVLPAAAGAWLWQPLWANRGLFAQAAMAAVLINIFAMATALFSMAVYNKVVPNNATQSIF